MMAMEAPTDRAGKLRRVLGDLGPFLGLLAVLILFSILEPRAFPSVANGRTVAVQTVIVGLGAIGMSFVIISGGIDLSVGSVIALASVVTAWIADKGHGPAVAALGGAACGALCGLINGVMITWLRVVPFIATLGMLGMARGVAKSLAEEQKIDAPAGWLAELMRKKPDPEWLLVAPAVWIMFGLAVAMAIVLRRSLLGARTYAIGSNEDTAHLCGVPVRRTQIAIYMICGLFAGIAGVLQFGRLTVGDPTTAMGKELDVIAAVVIGGASLSGGEGGIRGAIIGAFLMSFLANGCTLTEVDNSIQEILIGAIIVAAVAVDRWRHR